MIPYILHVTVILTVCFLFYKLFLQKATFYGLNRWTLLGCLVLSFVLPLLPAPRGWALGFAGTSDPVASTSGPVASRPAVSTPPALLAASVDPTPVDVAPSPVKIIIMPAAPPPSHPFRTFLLQGLQWLTYIYIVGLLVFGLKLVLQIFLLCYQSFSRPVIRDGRSRIVYTAGERGPCTFGNTIFINPALYDPETFQQILVHEKIHVNEGHTVDILLAELAVILQWFNPFVWLYRREVENNLEFLTDRSVLAHPDIERSAYQLSLLRVSAPHLPFSITNNYNQSLLKRRIVMMNSQKSARHTIWKYFVLLPILTALVCALNKPAALGQSAVTGHATTATVPVAVIPSDTASPPTRPTVNKTFTAADGTVTTLNGTISVKPAIVTGISSTAAITSSSAVTAIIPDTTVPQSANDVIHFIENPDIQQGTLVDMRQGSWFLTVDGDDMEFTLRAQSGENTWRSSFTVKKSEINPYPGQGTVEFKLVREAGTMTFKGSFDGEQGLGHFHFQPDESFFSELQKMGVEDMDDHTRNSFFDLNIRKDFVQMLNRNGYTPISQRDVVGLTIHPVDEAFLKYWKNSGVEDAGQVHSLFMLKALHIEPAYVEDLKKAGYTHLTVGQLIRLNRQAIDVNYIRAVNSGNSMPATPEELMVYKMMKIDSGYLTSLRKVGYDHLTQSEIRQLSSAHVTAEFIKGFQDAGFSAIPVQTLMLLKIRNASPADAKSFRDFGYRDLDLNQMANLRNEGITPDFVSGFHKIGYANIPFNTLLMLKMSGVDADYVAKMKSKGLNSPDLMKYVQLKRDFN